MTIQAGETRYCLEQPVARQARSFTSMASRRL